MTISAGEPSGVAGEGPASGDRPVVLVQPASGLSYRQAEELRNAGFETRVVASGRAALAEIRERTPQVVVLSSRLPDMPCADFLRALKQDPRPDVQAVRAVVVGDATSERERLELAVEGALDQVGASDPYGALPLAVTRCLGSGPEAYMRKRVQAGALRQLSALERQEGGGDDLRQSSALGTRAATEPAVTLPRMLLALTVPALTPRQQQIVGVLSTTDSIGSAAERLGTTPGSLSNRVRAIAARLGLAGPGELIDLARRNAVLDAVPAGVYGLDASGVCMFANAKAAELFGYRVSEVVGQDLHTLVHRNPDDGTETPRSECAVQATLLDGATRTVERETYRRDGGELFWASYTVVAVRHGDLPAGVVVTLRDITEAVSEAETSEVNRLSLQLTLQAGGAVTFQVDLDSGEVSVSDNFESLFGLRPGTFEKTFAHLLSCIHPDDRAPVESSATRANPPGTILEWEYRVQVGGGESRWFRSRACTIEGPPGTSNQLVGVAFDVTTQLEADRSRRMLLDTLTDAYVGSDAYERITEWNAAAERLFGIPKEEAIGKKVSALILPDRYIPLQLDTVDALHRRLEREGGAVATGPIEMHMKRVDGTEIPVELTFHLVPVGSSVAYRGFVRDISSRIALEATPEVAHRRTDGLLRDAGMATHGSHRPNGPRMEPEEALARALSSDQIQAWYQPIVSLADREVHGMAAVVRWCHPDRGMIHPEGLALLAEHSVLRTAVDEKVLRDACRQLATWRRTLGGLDDFLLSVTMSAQHLVRPGATLSVRDALGAAGLPASALQIELTDTALIHDPGAVSVVTTDLRGLGMRLAIDHFGAGPSFLSDLRDLPVQVLKLDHSFVAGLGHHRTDTTIVRATIELARALGLSTVAEGVNTSSQADILAEFGCDYAQGHLWGEAMPASAFVDLMRGHEVSA